MGPDKFETESTANSNIKRRDWLKAVGGTALFGLSGIGSAVPEGTEIIVIEKPDGTNVTTKVPNEWYQYQNRVDEQFTQIRRDTLPKTGVQGISQVVTDEYVGGRKVSKIRIYAEETVILPDVAGAIPIERQPPRNDGSDSECINNNEDYAVVNGGIKCSAYESGSTCVKVNFGSGEHILTCNHIFDSISLGDKLSQNGEDIGEIDYWADDHDIAIIKVKDYSYNYRSPTTDDKIRESSDEPNTFPDRTVYGHYTYDGFKELFSVGHLVQKQGTTTGREQGTIQEYKYTSNYDGVNITDGVITNCETAGGDSGGAAFAEAHSQDVAMVGLHSGHVGGTQTSRTNCGEYVWEESIEAAAYAIADRANVSFGRGDQQI
jgi:hypothetical protein